MSTVAEMLSTEPDRYFEDVDGMAVENTPMGIRGVFVASRLDQRMGTFAAARGLGSVVVEGLFQLDPGGRAGCRARPGRRDRQPLQLGR